MLSVPRRNWRAGASGYAFLAVALVSLAVYVFRHHPVAYTYLITEDSGVENASAICFGVAGLLFLGCAAKSATRLQRVARVATGVVLLGFAGEEMSWGQRIFSWQFPEVLRTLNTQDEFNLHNTELLDRPFGFGQHEILTVSILLWLAISIAWAKWGRPVPPDGAKRPFLIVPMRLLPVFLMAPVFLLWGPVIKATEIGEFFFSLAVVLWAVEHALYLRHPDFSARSLPAVIGSAVLLLVGLTTALTIANPPALGAMRWRLNTMALRYSSLRGMHEQAGSIYEYIYSHPKYLSPDTPLEHGKMLLAVGDESNARRILSLETSRLQTKTPAKGHEASHYRRLGQIHDLLGDAEPAEVAFDRASDEDEARLEVVDDPDSRASLFLSLAMTLEARGEAGAALKAAREAKKLAESASLRVTITKWIERHFVVP